MGGGGSTPHGRAGAGAASPQPALPTGAIAVERAGCGEATVRTADGTTVAVATAPAR
jgi:hypothetical protein